MSGKVVDSRRPNVAASDLIFSLYAWYEQQFLMRDITLQTLVVLLPSIFLLIVLVLQTLWP